MDKIVCTPEQKSALIEAARLMREGAVIRPQAFHAYAALISGVGAPQQFGTCALGAIYEARTGSIIMDDSDELMFVMIEELKAIDGLIVENPAWGSN